MPYGLGATECTASATLTRQLTKQMRLLLRYSYFNYRDVTSGGHNNYEAQSIYSGLQYLFLIAACVWAASTSVVSSHACDVSVQL